MRSIVVLTTVFSACCCFSVLNVVFFDANGQKYDVFNLEERDLLNNTLTNEEILRCQNFTDEIVKDLHQRPTEEEIQQILFECKLFLHQNIKLFRSKDKNDSILSPPFENYQNQEHDFYTERRSKRESSKEVKDENTGSSENSRSFPVTEKEEGKSTEKLDNQNTVNEILNSTDTKWNVWSYLFGASDSTKSSNENGLFENLKRSLTTESSINFLNATKEYTTTEISAIWNIVLPGTKWCGSGDIAENDDDLGYFEDVDRCCRTHDKCSDLMKPGESKYNLTNTSPFTVLNCKCDEELYNCLSDIDSVASNAVGNTFFNIFSRMCYMLDYPRICKKNHPSLGCLEYVIDKTAEKVYQWKPAKKYLKKPFTISGR